MLFRLCFYIVDGHVFGLRGASPPSPATPQRALGTRKAARHRDAFTEKRSLPPRVAECVKVHFSPAL